MGGQIAYIRPFDKSFGFNVNFILIFKFLVIGGHSTAEEEATRLSGSPES